MVGRVGQIAWVSACDFGGLFSDWLLALIAYASGGGVGEVLRNRTRAAGAKMTWIMTDDTAKLLCSSQTCTTARKGFIASARAAMLRCGADGIEFDFEGPATSGAADDYTDFLVELKAAVGPEHIVAADIAVWTDFPWVSPKRAGYETLDYINIMSKHTTADCS